MGSRRSETRFSIVPFYKHLSIEAANFSVVVESGSGVMVTKTAAEAEAVALPDCDAALGCLPS